jgi:magnesium transporter
MPELNWPLGYVMVLAVMAIIALGMIVFFVRKGWIGSSRAARGSDEPHA